MPYGNDPKSEEIRIQGPSRHRHTSSAATKMQKKNAKMRKMYVRSAHRHQSAEHEQEVHSILTLIDCHLQLYLSGGMEIVFTSGPFLIKVVFFTLKLLVHLIYPTLCCSVV